MPKPPADISAVLMPANNGEAVQSQGGESELTPAHAEAGCAADSQAS